jgi:aldose 1-epimerase
MKKVLQLCLLFILLTASTVSCMSNKEVLQMIEKKLFGKLSDGSEIYAFTLKNQNGMTAEIINYGAIVVSLTASDRKGKFEDIVHGYDNINSYVADKNYFGCIVGRYGNRIDKGKFMLDGKVYQLGINNGENHLHGGETGFCKRVWSAETIESETDPALKLTYVSKDGEEGYPGAVTITVVYTLTRKNELKIEYTGTTDKTTILNPTHHSYFNLSGNMNTTVLNHELEINADKITPVDNGLITTGKFADVANTPMDFRSPKKIGKDINIDYDQLKFGLGYDHNWVINGYNKKVNRIAGLYEAGSGRYMEVYSDQPGLQFYSGNFLDGSVAGKNGIKYQFRSALCLEAQCFPDSPNKPQFPSVILKPGEVYKQTTIYKFSTK